ncbi:exodeoxyribonuclease III [Trueperella bialowiezensis]|uniref:Exodeoxyribonuclease n=1 Tax=Trueperella bialowiezensis TaxID=312285 RepID=A0A3S5EW58_9ACTO|nr:exodeoxyribonuclease III [Trueperella bialowiezensis]VEI13925.1 Exodeoxyribonuclease [Trueperella bialowiezensis]
MLVATVNVNGIRAAVRKGMRDWVEETGADVILLQEVRAPEDLVADIVGEDYTLIQRASTLKGRAGVAIAVRKGLEVTSAVIGIGENEPDVDTGRWVEATIPELGTTFVSAYLHSGVADNPEKMAAKYAHLDRVEARLGELLAERSADVPHALVGGDFNIVHTERDIKNWKPNYNKTSGVLQPEIDYLDRWFAGQWVDTHRQLSGEAQGPYTWWSQRGKAFDNDAGWRIDYQMTTPELAERAVSARVDRAPSYAERWSDHAPLVMRYDV